MEREFLKFSTNFLLNDMKGILKSLKVKIEDCGVEPWMFGMITAAIYCGVISRQLGREIIKETIGKRGLND